MSKGSLKITSELRLPNASFRCCTVILQKESSRCRRISPVTGKAYDGMFRWFISEAVKLSSYSDESFFYYIGKRCSLYVKNFQEMRVVCFCKGQRFLV